MTDMHEVWRKARPISEFHEKHKGERYSDYSQRLTVLDTRQEAYHDLTLYVDDEGNYYESRFCIGD